MIDPLSLTALVLETAKIGKEFLHFVKVLRNAPKELGELGIACNMFSSLIYKFDELVNTCNLRDDELTVERSKRDKMFISSISTECHSLRRSLRKLLRKLTGFNIHEDKSGFLEELRCRIVLYLKQGSIRTLQAAVEALKSTLNCFISMDLCMRMQREIDMLLQQKKKIPDMLSMQMQALAEVVESNKESCEFTQNVLVKYLEQQRGDNTLSIERDSRLEDLGVQAVKYTKKKEKKYNLEQHRASFSTSDSVEGTLSNGSYVSGSSRRRRRKTTTTTTSRAADIAKPEPSNETAAVVLEVPSKLETPEVKTQSREFVIAPFWDISSEPSVRALSTEVSGASNSGVSGVSNSGMNSCLHEADDQGEERGNTSHSAVAIHDDDFSRQSCSLCNENKLMPVVYDRDDGNGVTVEIALPRTSRDKGRAAVPMRSNMSSKPVPLHGFGHSEAGKVIGRTETARKSVTGISTEGRRRSLEKPSQHTADRKHPCQYRMKYGESNEAGEDGEGIRRR